METAEQMAVLVALTVAVAVLVALVVVTAALVVACSTVDSQRNEQRCCISDATRPSGRSTTTRKVVATVADTMVVVGMADARVREAKK